MKAAVVTGFDKPLVIRDLLVPRPGPGQVLVRMEASGLCRTDIHAACGDWPLKPNPPFIPGHEGVGVIEEAAADVSTARIGKRVAIPWLARTCGHCRSCLTGWETLCERQENNGYSVDGAYAEYAAVHEAGIVEVPEALPAFEAAPLSCAGSAAYKAIKVAGVTPAERVAVFGAGGLGHMALQYARIAGALVTAVDIEWNKLHLAAKLGADHVVNARADDPVEALREAGGADVAVVLTAAPTAFEQAYRSLRRGGRLVCVGLPPGGAALGVPFFETVVGGRSVIGSVAGTRQELTEVFALAAAGRTEMIAEPRALDDVNACFDDVLGGRVPARLVFEF
ncbi:zinc-dependent alcohol dehydrogenase [Actinomadura soli]|uniref:Alcohol dehydrogenase n=1 Tax=Actinomadura soli TaxID=2508997 RepID=A0A5C4JFF1_9ACTN|nr:zinc-dependent alcohol dehydrogenase [Actinomadura soli]TMR04208.1 zinc-dependent alcohol dehydrogenase [Actinomadura soli]